MPVSTRRTCCWPWAAARRATMPKLFPLRSTAKKILGRKIICVLRSRTAKSELVNVRDFWACNTLPYNVEPTNNIYSGGRRVRGFVGIEVVARPFD